jgi:hypothetical protein
VLAQIGRAVNLVEEETELSIWVPEEKGKTSGPNWQFGIVGVEWKMPDESAKRQYSYHENLKFVES